MKRILFFIALLGAISAIIVHVSTILGIDVADKVPFIWVLHVLIFVVWIPTIFSLKKEQKQNKDANAFTLLTKNKPKWLIGLIIAIAVYTGFNFMFSLSKTEGTATNYENGVYSLQNRGKHIRNITEEEYHLHGANTVRSFSGHWILFYTIATIALYKGKSKEEDEIESKN